jgi:hypothetical protein
VSKSRYRTLNGDSLRRGLFAKRYIPDNTRIAEFRGEIKQQLYHPGYTIKINKRKFIDCYSNAKSEPPICIASMANTANNLICPDTGKILTTSNNNCRISISKGKAFIFTSRFIRPDEELLVAYNFRIY